MNAPDGYGVVRHVLTADHPAFFLRKEIAGGEKLMRSSDGLNLDGSKIEEHSPVTCCTCGKPLSWLEMAID